MWGHGVQLGDAKIFRGGSLGGVEGVGLELETPEEGLKTLEIGTLELLREDSVDEMESSSSGEKL